MTKVSLQKKPLKPRLLGKFKGKIFVSPDFDEESDEINKMFYGGKIFPTKPEIPKLSTTNFHKLAQN